MSNFSITLNFKEILWFQFLGEALKILRIMDNLQQQVSELVNFKSEANIEAQ